MVFPENSKEFDGPKELVESTTDPYEPENKEVTKEEKEN